MIKLKTVAQALKELEKERGYLKPEDVVAKAKPASSPIHGCFEWQNTKAAHGYRLWQARHLITKVKVEIEGETSQAYFNVSTSIDDSPQRGYFSAEKILSDEELYDKVIAEAVKEIKYWQTKYKQIKVLKGIVNDAKIKELE